MNPLKAITVLILILGACVQDTFAQYDKEKDATIPLDYFYIKREGIGFRRLLSKATFGLSTGFARTNFKHEITDFQILQTPGGHPIILQPSSTSGYINWFNRVEATPAGSGQIFSSDDGQLGFKSKAFQIPLRATLHFEIERFRIGGGYSFEFTHLGDFKPLALTDQISSFSPDVTNFFLKRYFGSFGASVYRYDNYLLVADLNIGGYKLGKNFDRSLIDKGLFINIGAAVEREMSEYFKLFVRPSYEVRSFRLGLPETGSEINHKFNAFYVNVGATYRIPELRRCFLKTCKAQMNHAHGNREYRSRVHPIHKKQNPHYGENHPTLIKYKGRNKYKLNPY